MGSATGNVPTGLTYMAHDVASRSSEAEAQFDVRYRKEHPPGRLLRSRRAAEAVIEDIRAIGPLR